MEKPQMESRKSHPLRAKHKHLGGKGLSLTAFANARTKTAYDPSQTRKQREHYKNAKKVNKYRKLVKRLEGEGHGNQFQIDRITLELRQEETTGAKESKETPEQQHRRTDSSDNEQDLLAFNGRVNQKNNSGSYKRQKNKNTLQKLREGYEKKQEEEEKLRKEKEAVLAARYAAREKSESKRKDMKLKMYKKTRSGQPVMKFRLEHLLENIQRSNQ